MKRLISTIALAVIIFLPNMQFNEDPQYVVSQYWEAANDTGHDCYNDWLTHMSATDKQTNLDACVAMYPDEN